MTSLKRSLTFFILLVFVTLAGCNRPDEFQAEFTDNFPKPEWFASVNAPSLQNISEVTTLWRSEERTGSSDTVKMNFKVIYKSCYNAIVDHYRDEALVVKCIPLMIKAAPKEQRLELLRFMIKNYGDFKQDITRCTNCMEADKIASATISLARYEYYSSRESKDSISLIESLMDKRGKEISAFKQALMFGFLGSHYLKQGVTPEVKTRYNNIHALLSNDVKAKKLHAHHLKRFEKTRKKIMAN